MNDLQLLRDAAPEAARQEDLKHVDQKEDHF